MLLHVALYPLCLTNTYFIPTLTGWVFRYSDTIEKPFSLLVAEKGVDETPTRGDYQIGGGTCGGLEMKKGPKYAISVLAACFYTIFILLLGEKERFWRRI